MQKISIIIPAYNEEQRIKRTLQSYISYFNTLMEQQLLDYEIVVVLNGCKDNTIGVVQEIQKSSSRCRYIDIPQSGKGLAIRVGFSDALMRDNDFIGFVDADMATSPKAYHDLLVHMDNADGIIASRYMKESKIYPPRPLITRWGSKYVYEPLVKVLLGLHYKDFQCGAKIFRHAVVKTIAPLMEMKKWAFDAEILYLCKIHGFKIKEYPTVWHDQVGSKLSYASGIKMLGSIINLRLRNSMFKRWFL